MKNVSHGMYIHLLGNENIVLYYISTFQKKEKLKEEKKIFFIPRRLQYLCTYISSPRKVFIYEKLDHGKGSVVADLPIIFLPPFFSPCKANIIWTRKLLAFLTAPNIEGSYTDSCCVVLTAFQGSHLDSFPTTPSSYQLSSRKFQILKDSIQISAVVLTATNIEGFHPDISCRLENSKY